jgi:hypothetical protein
VALEVDQVAAGFVVDALPEVREADVVEGGGEAKEAMWPPTLVCLLARTTMAMAFQRM